jgi:uncharacterized protein (TIGR03000 family)
MYSLVLMATMSAAPNTAEFNGYFRDLFSRGDCNGCNGCNGAARYSCNGCCGGSGLFSGDRIRSLFGPNNCCGGMAYSAGCCGGTMAFATGCCGGSIATFGGPVMSYTPMMNGGLSCFGTPVVSAPVPQMQPYPNLPGFNVPPPSTIPYAPPEVAPPSIERQTAAPRATGTVTGGSAANRATVIVRLPADAQLFADGTALKMTGGERKFITPELPGGMEFTYKFTAEYERNGEVLNVSKKITLRPGSTATVEFADLTLSTKPAPKGSDAPTIKGDSVAAAPVSLPKAPPEPAPVAAPAPVSQPQPATITVKLPAGSTLYVDEKKNASGELVRKFTTPPLPAGREFGYLLKVEVIRNGMPESLTQKVAFRAGEQLTVDLSNMGR